MLQPPQLAPVYAEELHLSCQIFSFFPKGASPGVYHKSFILVVQIGPFFTAHDHKWWLEHGLTCKQKDLSVGSKVKLLQCLLTEITMYSTYQEKNSCLNAALGLYQWKE